MLDMLLLELEMSGDLLKVACMLDTQFYVYCVVYLESILLHDSAGSPSSINKLTRMGTLFGGRSQFIFHSTA